MSKNDFNFKENLAYAALCLIIAAVLTVFTVFDETHDDYMGRLARHYDLYTAETSDISASFSGI